MTDAERDSMSPIHTPRVRSFGINQATGYAERMLLGRLGHSLWLALIVLVGIPFVWATESVEPATKPGKPFAAKPRRQEGRSLEPRLEQGERVVMFPEDIRVERDVAYLPPDRKQKADLYFPREMPAGRKLPAVVIIHGGGFNSGDKDQRREISIGANLARRGYVGMSIDYKLWNKYAKEPTWRQSLHDAKTAVRWLRKNADQFGIDPDRIGAIGCSAGGNLVSMLAVTGPADGLEPPGGTAVPTTVTCAVDFYGPVDLLNYHDMKMFLKTREEDPECYKQASPVNYCTRGDAPILLVHGTGDETVHVSQSETFAKALEAGGVEHELIVIQDAPHTFDLDYDAFDVKTPVFTFLDKHLKQP